MLKIKANQWFDLNTIGLFITVLISLLFVFLTMPLPLKLAIEIFLFISIYYLYKRINANFSTALLINSENQWFVEKNNETYKVELKDYWLLTQKIFIWLKGSNKSISLVVTRAVIGEQKFSQLRAKII